MSPQELMEIIVREADDHKAVDIMAIEVNANTTLTDYFIIMTGTSSTHIRALADHITEKLKNQLATPAHHTEGITSNWVLIDYSSVIVNIFTEDARELYALERLWADGNQVNLDKILTK